MLSHSVGERGPVTELLRTFCGLSRLSQQTFASKWGSAIEPLRCDTDTPCVRLRRSKRSASRCVGSARPAAATSPCRRSSASCASCRRIGRAAGVGCARRRRRCRPTGSSMSSPRGSGRCVDGGHAPCADRGIAQPQVSRDVGSDILSLENNESRRSPLHRLHVMKVLHDIIGRS
jgi:hypothetical protein